MLEQTLMVNPFALPLWLGGLAWLFFGREGRRYRVLGWAYVVEVGVWMALAGKDYYAAPAYPILFAAGGVAVEQWIEAHPPQVAEACIRRRVSRAVSAVPADHRARAAHR